ARMSPTAPPAPLSETQVDVSARLAAVRGEIAAACAKSGRQASEVTLLGASKTQPAEGLTAAFRAGLHPFGENRVQEASAKVAQLPKEIARGIEWHLIGPLQSNKVKAALDLFTVVHSIDRPKIAAALDREAGARGISLRGFLEINLGSEASKHGFPPEGLAAAGAPLAGLPHPRIVGLLAIPPHEADP